MGLISLNNGVQKTTKCHTYHAHTAQQRL